MKNINLNVFVMDFYGHSLFFLVQILTFLMDLQLTDSTWWYLSQFEREPGADPRIYCDFIPKGQKRQRQICFKHSRVMDSIAEGVRSAVSECQYQFRSSRWNCTTFQQDSTLFGKYLLRGGTRELSFLSAIITASAISTVSKDCSSGKLSACGCSSESLPHKEELIPKSGVGGRKSSKFKWKGCPQDVIFSLNFVRRFVDASESNNRDMKAKMNLHNYRTGRQVFEVEAPLKCKCHGLSGSCTMQSCWKSPASLRTLGDSLKEKYDGAIRITNDPSGKLIPVDKLQKPPSKLNLIYFEDSPNFCLLNRSRGLLGTENRLCNSSSENEDSCDILCCDAGYYSTTVSVSHRCQCKFTWCCEVQCSVCTEMRVESRCHPQKLLQQQQQEPQEYQAVQSSQVRNHRGRRSSLLAFANNINGPTDENNRPMSMKKSFFSSSSSSRSS